MDTMQNQRALQKVLDAHGVDARYYSIGGPAEQRVCLEYRDGLYHVYMVERGVPFEESDFQNEMDAHVQMLRHLSQDKTEFEQMHLEYTVNCIEVFEKYIAERKDEYEKFDATIQALKAIPGGRDVFVQAIPALISCQHKLLLSVYDLLKTQDVIKDILASSQAMYLQN